MKKLDFKDESSSAVAESVGYTAGGKKQAELLHIFSYLILSYLIYRLNYSTYLNGTAKDELDRLDRIEGIFRIQASKLTIEAHYKGTRLPDDWEIFKERYKDCLPIDLIKFIVGRRKILHR